jgi:hypothetical protein
MWNVGEVANEYTFVEKIEVGGTCSIYGVRQMHA